MTDWNKKKLESYISNKIEENKHLDYKGAGAIHNSDGKKKEISKDVSAFANSDGGIIIYGIREYDSSEKKHLPEKLDPIDRKTFSKEWLENIITGNISPIIEDITIHSVTIDEERNECAYVVEIGKSNTAHQAKDNRYYKRREFKSTPMEDWEVKDVINRSAKPVIEIVLIAKSNSFVERVLTKTNNQIKLMIRNTGNSAVNHINCYLIIDDKFEKLMDTSIQKIEGGFMQSSISNKKENKITIEGIESIISTERIPVLPGGILTEIGFVPIKEDLLKKDFKIHCIINTEYGIVEKEFEMKEIKQ